MPEEKIDAIKMTREIRDKIYEEEKGLSWKERQERRDRILSEDEIWQKLKKKARPAGSTRNRKLRETG